MRPPEYCQICEQELPRSLIGTLQAVKFKDGNYCVRCAEKKVSKKRREL